MTCSHPPDQVCCQPVVAGCPLDTRQPLCHQHRVDPATSHKLYICCTHYTPSPCHSICCACRLRSRSRTPSYTTPRQGAPGRAARLQHHRARRNGVHEQRDAHRHEHVHVAGGQLHVAGQALGAAAVAVHERLNGAARGLARGRLDHVERQAAHLLLPGQVHHLAQPRGAGRPRRVGLLPVHLVVQRLLQRRGRAAPWEGGPWLLLG
mmetsp:Transcript_2335/g.5878  ORF Transcript_2335/g.5878 Transcript_2335/m.5878 type:complete len:207 (-) Transcript_2335:1166-1786(-)